MNNKEQFTTKDENGEITWMPMCGPTRNPNEMVMDIVTLFLLLILIIVVVGFSVNRILNDRKTKKIVNNTKL